MAYRAEIEIGVKGANKLEQLQTRIDNLARKITDINDASVFDPIEPKLIQSVQNYSNALEVAAKNLKDVELGQDEERKAIQQYVQALGEANEARERQNRLVTQQIAKQTAANRVVREAATGFSAEVYGPQVARGTGRQGDPAFPFSPVGERVQRLVDIKNDQRTLDQALLDLEKKSAAELSKKVQLQQNLVEGTREVLELAARARRQQEFRAGVSGTAVAGPLAGPGSIGKPGQAFPVALPGLSEAELKGLRTAKQKLEIINRTVQRRKELVGLATNLQRLDGRANVAIADANRDQAKLNDLKQEQLELEEFITREQVKRSISRRKRIIENAKEARRRRKEAIGSGIIGGAFPLLFGQGAGASVGGAVGGVAGGLVGGQFGFGLSLVGTQLGTIFDTLVTKAGTLANSLNTTGEILSGLEEAGFKVSDATKSVIASYEKAGLLSDAYALALGEVNRVLGPGGVEKLDAYKTETQKLNDEFEKISGAFQSELIPALTGLLRIILGAKAAFDDFANSPLGQLFLKGAKELAFNAPGGGGLRGASFAIGALQAVGAPTGPAEKPTAQRLAEEAFTLDRLTTQQKLNKAAREERYLVAAQIDLARVGSDILKEEVVAARKRVIQETFLAAVRKEGITPQQVLLAGDRKRLATAQLEREISEANLKLAEQKTKELKKQEALQRKITDAQISAQLAQDIFAAQPLVDPTPFSRLTPEQKRQSALDLQGVKYAADKKKIENSITNEKIKQSKLDEAEANNNLALLKINNDYTNTIKKRNENYLTQTSQLQTQLNIITATTRQEAERLRLEQEFQALQNSNQFSPEQLQQIKLQKEDILNAQQPLNKFITDSTKALNDLEQVAVDVSQGIGSAVGNALTFGIDGLVAGTKSAQEVFADFLKNVAQLLLKTAAQMIATYVAIGIARKFAGLPTTSTGQEIDFTNVDAGVLSGLGYKANGGPVKSGSPYMVGERGPELFVPRSSGRVVPNGRFGGGGGGDVNVVVNVDAKGSNAQGSDRDAKTLGAAIGVAVRSELVKQKRPGGLLAS